MSVGIASVTTRGFLPPAGQYGLLATMVYGQSGEPPPPPVITQETRYGPALTPFERAKWFGASYESPIARQVKRKLLEKVKRQALGIIPADEIEETLEIAIVEKIEALAPRQVNDRPPKINMAELAAQVARAVAIEMREIIREQQENEEDEKIALLLMH